MRFAMLLTITAGIIFAQGGGVSAGQAYGEFQADVERETQAHIQALRAQVATEQNRLADLRSRYTDTHPDVVAAQKRIAELDAQLADAKKRLARYNALADVGIVPGKPPAQSPKLALPDLWWKNPSTVQFLGISAEQQRKMDDVVAQFRLKLTEETRALKWSEAFMQPMVSAEPLDEAKITAQIDRVADARAELEKTNGRMLLGIRKLLTPEQWVKLNQAFTLNLIQK